MWCPFFRGRCISLCSVFPPGLPAQPTSPAVLTRPSFGCSQEKKEGLRKEQIEKEKAEFAVCIIPPIYQPAVPMPVFHRPAAHLIGWLA